MGVVVAMTATLRPRPLRAAPPRRGGIGGGRGGQTRTTRLDKLAPPRRPRETAMPTAPSAARRARRRTTTWRRRCASRACFAFDMVARHRGSCDCAQD